MLSLYLGEENFCMVLWGSWSNGIELYNCAKGERFMGLFISRSIHMTNDFEKLSVFRDALTKFGGLLLRSLSFPSFLCFSLSLISSA